MDAEKSWQLDAVTRRMYGASVPYVPCTYIYIYIYMMHYLASLHLTRLLRLCAFASYSSSATPILIPTSQLGSHDTAACPLHAHASCHFLVAGLTKLLAKLRLSASVSSLQALQTLHLP